MSMKKSFTAQSDGSVTVTIIEIETGNAVDTVSLSQEDVLSVMEAAAHADAKHLVADAHAVITKGRSYLTSLWLKVSAAKSTVDTQIVNAEVTAEGKVKALQAAQQVIQAGLGSALEEAANVLGNSNAAPKALPVELQPAPAVEAPAAAPAEAPATATPAASDAKPE